MLSSFSPNMLKTYQTCPKKFYYQYIEHVNMPQSDFPFEKGKKIHALANYYLRGIKIDKLENTLTKEELKTWNLLLGNEYFNKECFKTEFSLFAKNDIYLINGRLDAVVKDDNKYFILDYKTGEIPPEPIYDFQTMIYLLCMDKYLKHYDELTFVYINLKENKNTLISLDKNLKETYAQKIKQMCEIITKDTIYKENSQNCKHCQYSKICNF